MTQTIGRREALKLAVLGAAAGGARWAEAAGAAAKTAGPEFQGLKVGLASYSTRELTLKATLNLLKQLRIRYISIKDVHLPLSSTTEERAKVKKECDKAGVEILTCGVISLKNDEKQMRHAFEYVRDLGAPTITIAPEPDALETLNKVIQDFDIRAAIHNHGPEDKRFPSPIGVFEAVQSLDKKIGCCVDVGHTHRLDLDPVEALRKCAPRLYGIHIKDLSGTGPKPKGVPVGLGVLDVVGMLKVLTEIRYQDIVALEYESEPENPVVGISESFGFLRGALAAL